MLHPQMQQAQLPDDGYWPQELETSREQQRTASLELHLFAAKTKLLLSTTPAMFTRRTIAQLLKSSDLCAEHHASAVRMLRPRYH